MEKLKMHELKINLEQLKSTAEYTEGYYADRGRVDIYYDRLTGEIWAKFFTDGNWCEYRQNPEVIRVISVQQKISQQDILDQINEEIARMKYAAKEIGEEYTDTWR